MRDFLAVMGPVIFLWSVPLIPMFATALVAVLETAVVMTRGRPESVTCPR